MRVFYLSKYFNKYAFECWLLETLGIASIEVTNCYNDAELVVAPGACNSGQISKAELLNTCKDGNIKVLCICGGFQALFGNNEETGESGASVFSGKVVKLRKDNGVDYTQTGTLKCEDNNEYFFNNSYGVISVLSEKDKFILNHGKCIVMIQLKNILGYQFHPELSGKAQEGLKKQMRSWFFEN